MNAKSPTEPVDQPLPELADFPRAGRLVHFSSSVGLKILVNGQIKITPPSEFNDPFEFSPALPPIPQSREALHVFFSEKAGLGAIAVDSLCDQRGCTRDEAISFCVAHPDAFPAYINCFREATLAQISANYGVLCFSDLDPLSPAAIRHWSVYADKHNGLAIEFDPNSPALDVWYASRFLFKVEYVAPRPSMGDDDYNDFRQKDWLRLVRRWGSQKAEYWRPENEWRLIQSLASHPDRPISRVVDGERITHLWQLWNPLEPKEKAKNLIRRVVLGCRAATCLEQSVRDACQHIGLQPDQVVRAQTHDSDFRLVPSRNSAPAKNPPDRGPRGAA